MHAKAYLIAILALLGIGIGSFFLIPDPAEEKANIAEFELKQKQLEITETITSLESEVQSLSHEKSSDQYKKKMAELQSARQALAALNQPTQNQTGKVTP